MINGGWLLLLRAIFEIVCLVSSLLRCWHNTKKLLVSNRFAVFPRIFLMLDVGCMLIFCWMVLLVGRQPPL
jgi:hypothetical protein